MTRSRILTALFALFILAAFVQPAAAHYDPKLGRWLERDPIGTRASGPSGVVRVGQQYADGASLYQYARSAPVQFVDPVGEQATPPQACIKIPRDDFVREWKKWHPGLDPSQYQRVEGCIDHGCIGVTCALLGNIDSRRGPDLSNCYDTFAQAQAKQTDMEATGACSGEKNCYDEQSAPKIFSVRFWSDGQAFAPDPKTGQIDMSPWSCTPRPRPGSNYTYVNFDFGYYDESSGRWYHANRAHQPGGRLGAMTVYCSTLAHYSRPLQDFDKQAFCVACDKWGFGKPGTKPNPSPGGAPWLP